MYKTHEVALQIQLHKIHLKTKRRYIIIIFIFIRKIVNKIK